MAEHACRNINHKKNIKREKPILNTVLFSGGSLDGLTLSVEHGQRLVTCIEATETGEVKHIYELSLADFTYQYRGVLCVI
ncbi:MAG: hypothetical protein H0U39_07515 [Segetibacter sp.]|nr:hypothetical protein [Segetibacter sp.]